MGVRGAGLWVRRRGGGRIDFFGVFLGKEGARVRRVAGLRESVFTGESALS